MPGVGVLTAVMAGVFLGMAVVLGGRVPPVARMRRLGRTVPGSARRARRRLLSWRWWWPRAGAGAGGGAGIGPVRLLRRAGSGGPGDVAAAVLAEQVAALARAGLAWSRVWQSLAAGPGPEGAACAVVARQVSAGGTAGEGLRSVDGAPLLGWLAIACDVAEQAGAPVADVLDRFAAAVRADAAAAADRDAALAGPRATTTVLSWLPLGGLGLGLLIGVDPVGTLLGTAAGRVCLVIGGGLWLLGRWWTRILVGRAERAGQ